LGVAASLRDIAIDLDRSLRGDPASPEVIMSFGSSSALARQIELGAPIDLIFSADAEIVEALADAGWVEPASKFEIARGRIVLAARGDSTLPIDASKALTSPGMRRLGLPAASIPLGRYGRAWLERENLVEGLSGKIVLTEDARANLVALEQGHVDLAIVYETDLRLAPSLQVIARPPADAYPPVRYVAARAIAAPPCTGVDRVLDQWRSGIARDLLLKAGFEIPPGEGSGIETSRSEFE
jgi:molybdate transport system substrate-binding protein